MRHTNLLVAAALGAFAAAGGCGTGNPAAEQPGFDSVEFKSHHAEIREHLEHIDGMAQRLAGMDPAEQRKTMEFISTFFRKHIATHAADEEKTVYPAADAKVGPRFTASMRYEHRLVGRWIAELEAMARGPSPDAAAFTRRTQRLLGLLEAHFGAEEEVVVPALSAG